MDTLEFQKKQEERGLRKTMTDTDRVRRKLAYWQKKLGEYPFREEDLAEEAGVESIAPILAAMKAMGEVVVVARRTDGGDEASVIGRPLRQDGLALVHNYIKPAHYKIARSAFEQRIADIHAEYRRDISAAKIKRHSALEQLRASVREQHGK